MPNTRRPRFGSMGYYPRKRTKKLVASVRCWANVKEVKPLGFAGYKVGMIHLMIVNNDQNSMTKGETISCPCTVIECPPLKIAGVRLYKKTYQSLQPKCEFFAKTDKELSRKIDSPKNFKEKIDDIKLFHALNSHKTCPLLISGHKLKLIGHS